VALFFGVMPGRTGCVNFCGESTGGTLELVKPLLGLRIHDVGGGCDKMYALGDEGCYSVGGDCERVSDMNFSKINVGKGHVVAVTTDSGQLYTWGTGEFGELGIGAKAVCSEATPVKTAQGPIVGFSCGSNHSVAIDHRGSAIAWGQNFNRQLGLYKKPKTELDIPRQKFCPNVMVEELLNVPRLLPFTIDQPVAKVACGSFFTVVLTKQGHIYTWGAGECGQLGTGRVTQRDSPSLVSNPPASQNANQGGKNGKKVKIVESPAPVWTNIAAGSGHVLAVTSSQQLYGWGFNKRGQLGTTDTDTRFAPTLVDFSIPIPEDGPNDSSGPATDGSPGLGDISAPNSLTQGSSGALEKSASVASVAFSLESEPSRVALPPGPPPIPTVANIYANQHSSACLLSDGALYTWGSSAYGRLMHGDSGNINSPTKVNVPVSDQIVGYAMSDKHSSFVVATQLHRITPEVGPQKSMKRLALLGSGFWDSEDIVVKFVNIANPFIPARSCMGVLESPGVVVCKPPRLAEAGDYTVSIALNGVDFAPETCRISMYSDPTIHTVKPNLVDMRHLVEMPKGAPANAKRKGMDVVVVGINFVSESNPDEKPDLIVRLNNSMAEGEGDDRPFVQAPGILVKLPKEDTRSKSSNDEDDEEEVVVVKKKAVERTITATIFKNDLMAAGRLLVMTTQISLNGGTDYSVDSDDTVIIHSFDAVSFGPACISGAVGATLEVHGDSFIPPSLVELEAVVALSVVPPPTGKEVKGKKKDDKKKPDAAHKPSKGPFNLAGLMELIVPFEYVSTQLLTIDVPSIELFIRAYADANGFIAKTPVPSIAEPSAAADGEEEETGAEVTGDGGEADGDAEAPALESEEDQEEVVEESPEIKEIREKLKASNLYNLSVGFRFKGDAGGAGTNNAQIGSNVLSVPIYIDAPVTAGDNVIAHQDEEPGAFDIELNGSGLTFLPGDKQVVKVVVCSPDAPNLSYFMEGRLELIGKASPGYYKCVVPLPNIAELTSLANGLEFIAPVTAPQPDGEGEGEGQMGLEEGFEGLNIAEPEPEPEAAIETEADGGGEGEGEEGNAEAEPEPEPEPIVLSTLMFGIMLDGITVPQYDDMARITIFGNAEILGDSVAVPKGGAPLGSQVVLECAGLLRSDVCKVRVRGINNEFVEVDGTIDISDAPEGDVDENMSITFAVPGSMGDCEPDVRGKDSFFFVDISMNGKHFNNSESPILQIKM